MPHHLIDLQKAEFKDRSDEMSSKLVHFTKILLQELKMVLSTLYDLHVFDVWQHRGILLMDGVLGDLLPDMDQGITELLESMRCNLAVSDGLKRIAYWI